MDREELLLTIEALYENCSTPARVRTVLRNESNEALGRELRELVGPAEAPVNKSVISFSC